MLDGRKTSAFPHWSEHPRQFDPGRAATRRRRDREDTTTLTIHVDRELHNDIKKLASKIERPAEVMLRRALRRLVTDAMKGRGNKYID